MTRCRHDWLIRDRWDTQGWISLKCKKCGFVTTGHYYETATTDLRKNSAS